MTDVAGQTGVLADVVSRTADAWREIQGDRMFSWMWEHASPVITGGTSTVSGTIPAGRYLTDSAKIGTDWLEYLPWGQFRRDWADTTVAGTPTAWSIRPDMTLVFNYTPSANTTVTVERYRLPTELVYSADTPDMPSHLHMAIVWKSVMTYASVGEEAGSLYASAVEKYRPLIAQIMDEQTMPITLGGPLC